MSASPRPLGVYVSGWCGTRNHARCAGSYAATPCTCPCHHETVQEDAPPAVGAATHPASDPTAA